MIRVVHVANCLDVGGAEVTLVKLVSRLDRARFVPEVVTLRERGPLADVLEDHGVTVTSLGMRRGRLDPLALLRLVRRLRAARPDVVHTWLYHSDLLGGLAARAAGIRGVVWGIRQSELDRDGSRRHTLAVARICARLSGHIPARITAVSPVARDVHLRLGYRPPVIVVPNGFDLDRFRPDHLARRRVRAELGIPPAAPVVGLLARVDPQKDHATFLAAARVVAAAHPDVRLVLAGGGTEPDGPLARSVAEAGLRDQAHLLGRRSDVPAVCAALDVAVSASAFGEGLPNAIAEAMACAVPCVVTDVGDSAALVGPTGRAVPPRNSAELAEAISQLLSFRSEERGALGAAARDRVARSHDLATMVETYQALYEEVAVDVRHRRAG